MKIGKTISHYKILEKLSEVRLRQGFVAQGGLIRRSFKINQPILEKILKTESTSNKKLKKT